MSEVKTKDRLPRSASHKQIKVGKWNDSLKTSDVNQIWIELHRIVSSHPLVRASKRAGFLVEEGKHNAYTDLTQELFVALLSKDRFQHYIDTEMSDPEIEAEIRQIDATEDDTGIRGRRAQDHIDLDTAVQANAGGANDCLQRALLEHAKCLNDWGR